MNLTVKGSRVFIRPERMPDQTEDGLLHLVNDRAASTMKGTVVAVGEGPEYAKHAVVKALNAAADYFDENGWDSWAEVLRARADRVTVENTVQPGDYVLFSPSSGEELIFEKEVLVAMREDDIMAVIEQEQQ